MSQLIKRAEADIMISRYLLTDEGNPTHDEMITDQAAYHVQQGIEKLLKYIMFDIYNMEYEKRYKTHKIFDLIEIVEENGDFRIPQSLKVKAIQITDWEAQSRYNDNSIAIKSDILDAIFLYEELKGIIENRQF